MTLTFRDLFQFFIFLPKQENHKSNTKAFALISFYCKVVITCITQDNREV